MTKDVISQPLKEGDIVGYVGAYSKSLAIGIVKHTTPTGANVAPISRPEHGSYRSSDKLIKVTTQYDIFKKEHPELFL